MTKPTGEDHDLALRSSWTDDKSPRHGETRPRAAENGPLGPFVYDFTHLGADRGPQDIPARDLQVDRMEDPRPATDSQTPQSRPTFQPAVGPFDATAQTVPLAKGFRRLLPTTTGQTTLLGRVLKPIAIATAADRALIPIVTAATCRFRHDRSSPTGLTIMNTGLWRVSGPGANHLS